MHKTVFTRNYVKHPINKMQNYPWEQLSALVYVTSYEIVQEQIKTVNVLLRAKSLQMPDVSQGYCEVQGALKHVQSAEQLRATLPIWWVILGGHATPSDTSQREDIEKENKMRPRGHTVSDVNTDHIRKGTGSYQRDVRFFVVFCFFNNDHLSYT